MFLQRNTSTITEQPTYYVLDVPLRTTETPELTGTCATMITCGAIETNSTLVVFLLVLVRVKKVLKMEWC